VIGMLFELNRKRGETEMYEKPKLNRVGEAQDVILGIIHTGQDIDTHFMIRDLEYACDEDNPLPPES